MTGPDVETAAKVIAESVVSAIDAQKPATPLHPLLREALLVELMRQLLLVLPTQSGSVLTEACNRCLDRIAVLNGSTPRVDDVDPDDGSVTMRSA